MKFEDLYNKVFVSEQENTEVAHPDDFDDVDPIPLPTLDSEQPTEVNSVPQASPSLTDYMNQCNEFADKLQSANGACLQALVTSLDRPATPFEGISNTKSDVENAAKLLRILSGKLLSYNIAAAKK